MGGKLNTIFHQVIHSKAQKKLDVCESMNLDFLNMGVRILTPNALEKG
jgi:hypothetical protein